MVGLRKEDAGGGANPRATARSWAVCLLTQALSKFPDEDEFRVKFTRKPGKQFDVEVTVVSGRDPGAD
jgi:hypothetical protein